MLPLEDDRDEAAAWRDFPASRLLRLFEASGCPAAAVVNEVMPPLLPAAATVKDAAALAAMLPRPCGPRIPTQSFFPGKSLYSTRGQRNLSTAQSLTPEDWSSRRILAQLGCPV